MNIKKYLLPIGILSTLFAHSTLSADIEIFKPIKKAYHKIVQTDPYISIVNEKQENLAEIKRMEKEIELLEKRNQEIDALIKKNPKLYEVKKLQENTKNNYFYRVKLGGQKTESTSVVVDNNVLTITIVFKQKGNEGLSKFFSTTTETKSFTLPVDADINNIKSFTEGDYFTVKITKKQTEE